MSASIQKHPQLLSTPNNQIPSMLSSYVILITALLTLAFILFGWDTVFMPA